MTAHDAPASDDSSTGNPAGVPTETAGCVHLRFPGGRLRPEAWTALAQLATEHSGALQLSDGGSVQIHGVQDMDGLRERVEASVLASRFGAGPGHTILASPLAGRLPGRSDLGDLPEQLDTALGAHQWAAPRASALVIGLDDGSGDVLTHVPDLAAVVRPEDGLIRIHAGGQDTGFQTSSADVVAVLVDAAVGLSRRPETVEVVNASTQMRDLVVVTLADHPLATRSAPTAPGTPAVGSDVPPVGWVDTLDGLVTLLAVVADGMIPARLAEFLGAIERPSTISADRVIGLHGLTEYMAEQVVRVLAPMGMVFDAASPWVRGTPET